MKSSIMMDDAVKAGAQTLDLHKVKSSRQSHPSLKSTVHMSYANNIKNRKQMQREQRHLSEIGFECQIKIINETKNSKKILKKEPKLIKQQIEEFTLKNQLSKHKAQASRLSL